MTKYVAIFDTLRQEILGGKFAARARFPSEEALVRRFGVSRPTVERALRELKRAGLLVSRAGSGSYLSAMAHKATGAIGLIVPDDRRIDFFTSLCTEIARCCRARGYGVLTGDVSACSSAQRESWTQALAQDCVARRVAGVILEPIDLVDGSSAATLAALRTLKRAGIPVVLVDRDIQPPPHRSVYDLIGIDNVQAGYRIARHLLDCGARRIRFLTEARPASTIRQRIQGVAQALLDAGGTWRTSYVLEFDPEDGDALKRLFAGKRRPDAIVCRNDALAARLIRELADLRIDIPRSVRVAGFDDATFARTLTPPLTSIRQPVVRIAEAATQALLDRIRKPETPPKSILFDADLICRASTVGQ